MVDDFLRKQDLIGLNETEVMERLGADDNGMFAGDNSRQAVYNLGTARAVMAVHDETLYIYFDDQGHVDRYEIKVR
ncbi:hypothetical protein JCM10914_3064 [Paenibacillus sp. JCM 10914]|nr:hypothetical protein JCM10914_3064 [Paenibacillus sp. JCM 10914]